MIYIYIILFQLEDAVVYLIYNCTSILVMTKPWDWDAHWPSFPPNAESAPHSSALALSLCGSSPERSRGMLLNPGQFHMLLLVEPCEIIPNLLPHVVFS